MKNTQHVQQDHLDPAQLYQVPPRQSQSICYGSYQNRAAKFPRKKVFRGMSQGALYHLLM